MRREDWSALVARPLECVRGFPAERSVSLRVFCFVFGAAILIVDWLLVVIRRPIRSGVSGGAIVHCRCAPSHRGAIARLGVLDAARSGSRSRSGLLGVRSEILAESDASMDLVVRLEATRPVKPMGVALANVLVTDADSLLRVGAQPGTLYAVVRLATVALDSLPAHGSRAGEA